jgi:putative hydrolase of the HAD superfamily
MLKVLLLDADGVLIHAEMFSKQLERDYGIPYAKIEPFFTSEFQKCLIGEADLREVIAPHLEEWGWKGSVDELLNFWFKAEHIIDQDLIDYILTLRDKGIRLFVATNQEKHRAQYMLDKMGFSDVFEQVYASAHLGHRKPAIDFFAKLHERLADVEKHEIVFWDDSEENVKGAREYGIQAEIYTGLDDFKRKMEDYLRKE